MEEAAEKGESSPFPTDRRLLASQLIRLWDGIKHPWGVTDSGYLGPAVLSVLIYP